MIKARKRHWGLCTLCRFIYGKDAYRTRKGAEPGMQHIGLDIGTSGMKASLFDETGRELAYHRVPYGFSNTDDGYRELDADRVWQAALTCLTAVAGAGSPVSVTVSSLGEAIVPVNEDGAPLCPGITGTDRRGSAELEELARAAGEAQLVEITGQNLSVIYSANKILWLMRHRPALYRKAHKILTFQDYVIFRLCGEAVIDRSMACRTLLMDRQSADWSPRLLALTGIDREKLARIVPAGTVAGILREDVRSAAGLPRGVRVVAGTHDHICNALGCGVLRPGDCSNAVGTTEGLTAVLEGEWLTAEQIARCGISKEPFAVPGLYNTVAWSNTSGVLLRWFALQMARERPPEELLDTYDALNEIMPSEPTGLLVLPHFSGAATPWMDERSRGAVLGLTLDTRREDLYKAIMEGTNYELKLILECLEEAGLKTSRVVSSGGAATPKLLQIKADVLGLCIDTVKNESTGTMGCAMLGAVAAGDFASLKEAAEAMVRPGRRYEPDPRRSAVYAQRMAAYRSLYPAIRPISRMLP